LAHIIANAVAERLGSDIVMLDMHDVSLLADYFILCNAESKPQFSAIVDEVQTEAKEAGSRLLHSEGDPGSGWVLLDFGSIVVHIFAPQVREFYNLEELWSKAKLVVRIQ
jgi:ribosome-associated protein